MSKYLKRETCKSWEEIGDDWSEKRKARMYKALSKLDAPSLTIFLLCIELGSQAEVARRLKVHRSTVMRIYNKITKGLRDELGNI